MDWNNLRRAKTCFGCERRFTDGEGYYTLLFLNVSELTREDYCMSCGEKLDSSRREQCLSSWQGRYKAEAPKAREEPIARSVVERLLRKYLHSGDPSCVNVRYILALMMERKRKLIPRDRIVDPSSGGTVIVYELSTSGETFLIEDPGLELKHTREVQKQVRELLEREGIQTTKSRNPDSNPQNEDSQ